MPPDPLSGRGRPGERWLLAGLLAAAAGLRLAAASESFWLDEIWSYFLAFDLERPWHAVTRLPHDNNHILNTLFVRALGEREHWVGYRGLSLATGTACVWLLYRAGGVRGAPEAWSAGLLGAFSYPLVLVSAQSRGYAPAMCFSLAALLLLRERWRERRSGVLLAFWLACALGLLSHLTFLYAYLGLLAWSLLRQLRPAARDWSEQLRCHGPPVLLLLLLYALHYRDLVIGGGPREYQVLGVVRQVLAWAVGVGHGDGAAGALASLFAAGVFVAGLARLLVRRSGEWIFFATTLLVAPVLLVLVADPRLFFPRYLLACIPFFYLLAASLLGALWRSSRLGAGVTLLLLAAFVAAHGQLTFRLLSIGTNVYRDTIAYLDAHTPPGAIRVGGDHDFRTRTVLRFYAPRVQGGERIVYDALQAWPEAGPEWYLRHSWLAGVAPEPSVEPLPGRRYTLVARFNHGPGYGFSWYVYRRDAPDP